MFTFQLTHTSQLMMIHARNHQSLFDCSIGFHEYVCVCVCVCVCACACMCGVRACVCMCVHVHCVCVCVCLTVCCAVHIYDRVELILKSLGFK